VCDKVKHGVKGRPVEVPVPRKKNSRGAIEVDEVESDAWWSIWVTVT